MYPLTTSKVEDIFVSPSSFGRLLTSFSADRLGVDVRVFDQIPKTVVFLGVEQRGQFSPVGTGFLGKIKHGGFDFTFLVTADHVVEMIPGNVVWVRMNRKIGDATTFQLGKGNRILDKKNDISIFPLMSPHDAFDQVSVMLMRENRKEILKISDDFLPGIGDEVVTVGLYTSHQGEIRNSPIVRIGNIAKLPTEPVRSTRGYSIAYLIETRSIAGLSGSPVFLNLPNVWVDDNKKPHFLHGQGRGAYVIGMMLGYHLVSSKEDEILVPATRQAGVASLTPDERNTGFGVVIPFERILEMVERPELKEVLDRAVQDHLAKIKVRPASSIAALEEAVGPPASDDNPTHREDFTALLNAAARTPKPDDQT